MKTKRRMVPICQFWDNTWEITSALFLMRVGNIHVWVMDLAHMMKIPKSSKGHGKGIDDVEI